MQKKTTKGLEICKRLHYQINGAQELQNCDQNLISQKQVYVLTKFMTKGQRKYSHHMNFPFIDKQSRITSNFN